MIRYATTGVFSHAHQPTPSRATPDSAGIDISTPRAITLSRGDSVWIDTGLRFAIPAGCVGLIRSRSGLRRKHRISAFHGTIDPDYRGPLIVELTRDDYDAAPVTLEAGSRIAQLVVVPCVMSQPERGELDDTDRGARGFGSTGL